MTLNNEDTRLSWGTSYATGGIISDSPIDSFKLIVNTFAAGDLSSVGFIHEKSVYDRTHRVGYKSGRGVGFMSNECNQNRGPDRVPSYPAVVVREGDIIECICDREAGTISYRVFRSNGKMDDFGIAFRGEDIKTCTLLPAVTFYAKSFNGPDAEVELIQ